MYCVVNASVFSRAARHINVTLPLLLSVLLISGCSGARDRLTSVIPFREPTPVATPTLAPSSTPLPVAATPLPTTNVGDGQSIASSTPTPIPTPYVIIPDKFSKVTDVTRGYSLAIPSGWQEIDLRGKQVSNIASMIGQAEAVEQLQEFLATEQGQSIGILAATDLTSVVWGGFPTLLNVSILDASNSDAESIVDFVQEQLEANSQRLGDFDVQEVVPTTINNLPAVTGTGAVDLSNFGRDVKLFVETVALLANDKVYMLTLATPTDKVDDYETMFDQIIGTFRPE